MVPVLQSVRFREERNQQQDRDLNASHSQLRKVPLLLNSGRHCAWRVLPVGTGRRLSSGRVAKSAIAVRVSCPPHGYSATKSVDIPPRRRNLILTGGVPTGT